ncbi:MAG: dockerin type I domain-containing protein [Planctomycetota bacterium]|nr:dockerin type I domain-containing protein [Planctomycetota bacterium]
MARLQHILCVLLALIILPCLEVRALASEEGSIEVSGPAQSITARTLTVRDEIGSNEPWTVLIESKTSDVIVLGLSPLGDEKSDEIEIPFLVVVPKDGEIDSQAMIIVMRGEKVIWIEVIEIHRTPDPADINLDGRVDAGDLTLVLSNWGRCVKRDECLADINNDGWVDGRDMSILVAAWHS